MIISTIKVSATYDSPLFLQTGAGHFTIRDLPTSAISTTFSLNNGSNQDAPSDGSGNQKNDLSRVSKALFILFSTYENGIN